MKVPPNVVFVLTLPSLLLGTGCGVGGSSESSKGEQVVGILKTAMPEDQARAEVRRFEESLAKKSPQYNRELAWTGYIAEAERRVAKARAENETRNAVEAEEAARWVGAEERWAKWMASNKSKGHLLDHLLVLRNLGPEGIEGTVGAKFVEKRGYGFRLTLETDQGIRIDAALYGASRLRNAKTGKWDVRAKSKPITGFEISMANGQELKKDTVLKQLGLPEGEFKSISVRWAEQAFTWKKLPGPLGNGGDDLSVVKDRVLIFWAGP